jgi:putative spermidine/putrescine transport system permease protein
LTNSFATQWFGTWWPNGLTTDWYVTAWHDYDLLHVLLVTLEVSAAVVVVSTLIGVPASYVLARRTFPGKRLVMLLFLLPILVPPIAYGIPLATVLHKYHLAGTLTGVLAASILVLVRTVAMFELTFLTAGPESQTLVVALYNAMFAAGIRAQQSIDAMAVLYTLTMMILLLRRAPLRQSHPAGHPGG